VASFQCIASVQRTRTLATQACVYTSIQEKNQQRLLPASIESAAHHLKEYGYCVIPRLLDTVECRKWGNTVLLDLKEAATTQQQQQE